MKFNSSLNKNIIYLALVQGSVYILPLLTFPYLVRVLGPEFFGVLGFCQATIQYLVLLTDYGFNWTATQQVAKYREDKRKLTTIFWSVVWSKLSLAFFSFIILSIICFLVPKYKDLWLILLSFSPMVLGNVFYPIWFFQGMERMKWITLCSISARLMLIPWTFLFVKGPEDLWIAALAQGATNFLAGLIGLYLIYRHKWIGKIEFSMIQIAQRLKDGWHVFISTSAISLYTTSTTIILGFIAGPVAVGYFNSANTIRNAAQGLLNPISQAIYPRINNLFDKDYQQSIGFIRKALKYIGGLSFTISLLLFVLAPYLIKYGVGGNYDEAIDTLRIMAFLPFIVSLSNIFGVQTMLTHGYKKQFSTILLSSGFFNVVIIFPLISLFRYNGAAMALVTTEIVVTLVMYLFLRKKNINLLKY